MRILFLPAVGVLAVMAGAWSLGGAGTPTPTAEDVDPVVSGSIPRAAQHGAAQAGSGSSGTSHARAGKTFAIANIEARSECIITRGEQVTHFGTKMSVTGDCEQVWSGLSRAATWTDAGDGTVVVADASGEAILTLAETDGLYEVIDPSNAIITMQSAE